MIIVLPLILCGVLWYTGQLSGENFVFLAIAMIVMTAFVSVLGVHSGMTYFESRVAVAVSLSTVLFLLLRYCRMHAHDGCLSGLLRANSCFAFSAFMLGGGAGMALAIGTPKSFQCHLRVFHAYAFCHLLRHHRASCSANTRRLSSWPVITYGFATATMLVPAVDEFDVATGRTTYSRWMVDIGRSHRFGVNLSQSDAKQPREDYLTHTVSESSCNSVRTLPPWRC